MVECCHTKTDAAAQPTMFVKTCYVCLKHIDEESKIQKLGCGHEIHSVCYVNSNILPECLKCKAKQLASAEKYGFIIFPRQVFEIKREVCVIEEETTIYNIKQLDSDGRILLMLPPAAR